MVAELNKLKNEDLPAALARLKEAIGQGDISENSEYDTAIAEKELIESRIAEIEAFLADVQIIEEDKIKTKDIRYGSKVKFEIVESGKTYEFTIVGSGEVDILAGTISFESPLGSSLKGKQKGDVVRVRADSGRYDVKIVDVR
ncbi:transcription elongation factor GreA [Patescibacteria group bacterium]|nr:transcription elongation factor GreA [Patescibacteria group bacterium]